jgi:hypothetical protein
MESSATLNIVFWACIIAGILCGMACIVCCIKFHITQIIDEKTGHKYKVQRELFEKNVDKSVGYDISYSKSTLMHSTASFNGIRETSEYDAEQARKNVPNYHMDWQEFTQSHMQNSNPDEYVSDIRVPQEDMEYAKKMLDFENANNAYPQGMQGMQGMQGVQGNDFYTQQNMNPNMPYSQPSYYDTGFPPNPYTDNMQGQPYSANMQPYSYQDNMQQNNQMPMQEENYINIPASAFAAATPSDDDAPTGYIGDTPQAQYVDEDVPTMPLEQGIMLAPLDYGPNYSAPSDFTDEAPTGFLDSQPETDEAPTGFLGDQSQYTDEAPTGFLGNQSETDEAPTGYLATQAETDEAPTGYLGDQPQYTDEAPTGYLDNQPQYTDEAPTGYLGGQPQYTDEAPTGYLGGQPQYTDEAPTGYLDNQQQYTYSQATSQAAPNSQQYAQRWYDRGLNRDGTGSAYFTDICAHDKEIYQDFKRAKTNQIIANARTLSSLSDKERYMREYVDIQNPFINRSVYVVFEYDSEPAVNEMSRMELTQY